MNRNGSILFLIFAGSSVEFFSLFPLIFPFSALIELEVLSINIQIVHIFYITVKKSNSSKKILLLPKKKSAVLTNFQYFSAEILPSLWGPPRGRRFGDSPGTG